MKRKGQKLPQKYQNLLQLNHKPRVGKSDSVRKKDKNHLIFLWLEKSQNNDLKVVVTWKSPQEKPPTFFIPSSFDRPRSAKNDGGTRKTVVPESFPRNDLRTKIFAFLRFVIVSIVLSSFETWTSQNNQKTSFQARSPTLT